MLTNVPATRSPEYKISADVNLVPINDLGCLVGSNWKKYVIIGKEFYFYLAMYLDLFLGKNPIIS